MKDTAVAIIGRPNVGKSTLFNALLRKKDAITEKVPGVTRDRKYGFLIRDERRFILIDTGGYATEEDGIITKIRQQTLFALSECDVAILVVDGRVGLMPSDEDIVEIIRKQAKPVILAVNKVDNDDQKSYINEFSKLGIKKVISVSAEHRINLECLIEEVEKITELVENNKNYKKNVKDIMYISIVGQPNSGKSTLVNHLLGEERMIVSSKPGTTRDSVDSEIIFHGTKMVLIDTAGLRKKGKVEDKLEVYSILRTIKSIERSDIVFLMIDVEKGISTQDQKIAALIKSRLKGLVVVFNKWDIMNEGHQERLKALGKAVESKFNFYPNRPFFTISALEGKNVGKLIDHSFYFFQKYRATIKTSKLNAAVSDVMDCQFPGGAKNFKIFYGVQTDVRPPRFKFFINSKRYVNAQLIRHLEKRFTERLDIAGIPIIIDLVERR